MRPISDGEWFAIRDAARRLDFDEVSRRAESMGMLIVAHHAKRATFDRASLSAVWYGLLLDQPDAPDPFAPSRSQANA
jgi:hypothetical protein